MAVLQWLEATRLSILIREGDTIWGYPTILTLHTFGMGLLVGPAAVIDLLLLGIGGAHAVGSDATADGRALKHPSQT
jgi:hypothetical protein